MMLGDINFEMKNRIIMTNVAGKRSPREVVAKIRSLFLLDVESESDYVKEGALNLQTQYNEALRLLSVELYSKKSHFVLELIQNADDNRYELGTTPQLTFEVTSNRLVVVNNEIGFRDENIEAICKVGASSKPKEKSGYIGEKGIGFKSVFTVSDAPEIHSNGFHIKFDRTVEGNLLGYIVPQWCEPPEEVRPNCTTIILPASKNYSFGADTLAALDARLLLFLNTLRQLTLDYDNDRVTYRRVDSEEVSSLTAEREKTSGELASEEMRYVRVSSRFAMDEAHADQEKRAGIGQSTVVLAFPIDAGGAAKPEPSSNVFAFLPIRQMGFKFSIQGDFILSASREEILTDRPWNQFLRDQIATVFSSAVEVFKKSEGLALSYLKYVPDEHEVVDPFFRTVRKSIIAKLSGVECLRSASGVWKRPGELLRAEKAFRALFPSKLVIELTDFDYVDAKILGSVELLRALGVTDVGPKLVVDVLREKAWFQAQPLAWRAKFYAYVADNRESLTAVGLLQAPCLPISDGSCVVPSQVEVFFPLSRRKKYGFESELVFVDNELYEEAAKHSKHVVELFSAMKVRSDVPYDLISSHILPTHASDAWTESEDKAIVGHLRYVKDKLKDYLDGALVAGKSEQQAYQALRDGIRVGTKQQEAEGLWIFRRVGELYLSKEYRPDFSIESFLGDQIAAEKLVSPSYLTDKPKDPIQEADSWRQFFTALGVRLTPAVESDGAGWKCSAELQLLLDSSNSAIRKVTLECMDSAWESYAKRMSFQFVIRRAVHQAPTKFAESLRATRAPTKKRTTVALSESYYPTPELSSLLGDAIPYVDARMSEAMLDDCHVTRQVDAKALVKRLTQMKGESAVSPKRVQAIYRALDDRFWHSDAAFIKNSFEIDRLIQVKGLGEEWFGIDEISWRQSSAFLDSLYPPVQGRYRDFSKFFTEKLGVPKELPVATRVGALERLSEVADVGERKAEALAIYQRANGALRQRFGQEVKAPEWLEMFEDQDVYINHRGEMVANDEFLFANDDPFLAALFSEDDELSFIGIPSEEVPRLSRLFDMAGVSKLSESVSIKVGNGDLGVVDEELTLRIRSSVHFFARVLYSKATAAFDQALNDGRFADLKEFEVAEVPQVELVVSLGDRERETTTDIARSRNRILYRTGTKSVEDKVAEELSRFLVSSADLADTLARILMGGSVDVIEDFLEVRHIGALPSDLRKVLFTAPGQAVEEDKFENEEGSPPNDADANAGIEVTSGGEQPAADLDPGPNVPSSNALAGSQASNAATSTQYSTLPPADSGGSRIPSDAALGAMPPRSAGIAARSSAAPTSLDTGSSAGLMTSAGTGRRPPSQGNGDESKRGAGTTYPPPKNSLAGKPKRGESTPPRTRGGRLLSYVAGPGDADKPNPEDDPVKIAARKATERAAVDYFMTTQAGRWKSLTEMSPNNPGFDVKALTDDGQDEFIEIKGQSGAWTEEGVALTPNELMTASQKGNSYWLCVVEYAHDDKRRQLHLVRNVYDLIQQFRFDVGWKSAAETDAAALLKPEKDLYIDMSSEGRGRIMSVRRKGQFFNLHVILDDGRQVNKLYNPAKMTLSKELVWQG